MARILIRTQMFQKLLNQFQQIASRMKTYTASYLFRENNEKSSEIPKFCWKKVCFYFKVLKKKKFSTKVNAPF